MPEVGVTREIENAIMAVVQERAGLLARVRKLDHAIAALRETLSYETSVPAREIEPFEKEWGDGAERLCPTGKDSA